LYRYSVSLYIPKARICFKCFKVEHVSKVCKGKARCIFCGNDKHVPSESCPRAQSPFSCVNCSGDHLATSHFCPDVVKRKMILSMASAKNIPFSEAKRSIHSQSYNSSPSQYADPRFDFWNFPNLPSTRSNPSPPIFESFNRFSLLQDCEYNLSHFSSPVSFASAAKRRSFYYDNNNNKKPAPRNQTQHALASNNNTTAHRAANLSSHPHYFRTPISPILRDHYDLLAHPNGRPSFSSENGVALPIYSPQRNPMPVSFPGHSYLLKNIYHVMNNISSILNSMSNKNPPLFTDPQNSPPPIFLISHPPILLYIFLL